MSNQITQRFDAKELQRLARMCRPSLSPAQYALRGTAIGLALVLVLRLLGF